MKPYRPPYAPETREKGPGRDSVPEHRCSACYGPYGKSAIRCKNEPEPNVEHPKETN